MDFLPSLFRRRSSMRGPAGCAAQHAPYLNAPLTSAWCHEAAEQVGVGHALSLNPPPPSVNPPSLSVNPLSEFESTPSERESTPSERESTTSKRESTPSERESTIE
eukprot:CAMPEP_0198213750 /NCGR_PEP_ID=MMETSP1445-20131203/32161_1 /TAXON_ID=36898 /ORGANISM="Pyramimonas sp., Strain CCMP2087" /LENGTH=105 /DNA_ID=CAMNT_0043888501 /DNA_START=155 /DNA_END=471 /DNA_ORIENTATION=+